MYQLLVVLSAQLVLERAEGNLVAVAFLYGCRAVVYVYGREDNTPVAVKMSCFFLDLFPSADRHIGMYQQGRYFVADDERSKNETGRGFQFRCAAVGGMGIPL